MNAVNDFFAALFSKAVQPILILDREQAVVYRSPEMKALSERLGMKTEYELLSPPLLREAESCLIRRQGALLPILLNEQMFTVELTPYFYAEEIYAVLRLVEKPSVMKDEELRALLMNCYESLRRYLNYIYGAAQQIGLDTDFGKTVAQNVRRLLRMADHLQLLLGGEGRMEYQVPMDVERFVTAYFHSAGELGARVQKLPGEGEVGALAKLMPETMELVLNLLVSNAVRFGGDALISTFADQEKVCILVQDNGPGVAEPMRLFEWGYRTPDARGAEGLGFGLPLAKKLLEQQGAKLIYEREEGLTTFAIELNRVAPDENLDYAEWVAEGAENSLSQMRIELSDILGG